MWKVPRRGRRPHTLPGFPLGKRLSSAIAPRLFTQCLLRTVPLPPSPHLTLPSFFLTRHIPDGWFTCSHLFFSGLHVYQRCRSTERRASACTHLAGARRDVPPRARICPTGETSPPFGVRVHVLTPPRALPGNGDTHFTKNVFRKRCISGRRERIPRRTLSHGLTSVADTHQQLWGPTDSCQAFFFFFFFS